MKKGYAKTPTNKVLASAFGSFCTSIGIIAGKYTKSSDLTFAIMLLVLAYSLTPTYSGFHKFYLIIKRK